MKEIIYQRKITLNIATFFSHLNDYTLAKSLRDMIGSIFSFSFQIHPVRLWKMWYFKKVINVYLCHVLCLLISFHLDSIMDRIPLIRPSEVEREATREREKARWWRLYLRAYWCMMGRTAGNMSSFHQSHLEVIFLQKYHICNFWYISYISTAGIGLSIKLILQNK